MRLLHRLFKRKAQLPVKEQWRLTAYYKGTKRVAEVLEGKNLIMAVGKAQLCDMLIDVNGYNTGFTYCALGSDDTAPADDQTALVNEGGNGGGMRLTFTSKTRLLNVLTFLTFFTAAQSTLNIKEAAIFGHSTASGTRNSGIMWSRWLVNFDNSGALYDVSISYILTLG